MRHVSGLALFGLIGITATVERLPAEDRPGSAIKKAFEWPDSLHRGGIYKPRFDRPWKVMNEPFLAGMLLWNRWNDAEAVEGTFDWSYLDKFLARLDKNHRAMIRFRGSRYSPEWVFNLGIPVVKENGYRMPAYWHPRYMDKFEKAVHAFGRKYDGHPKVELVHIQVGLYGEVLVNSKEWFQHGFTPEKWVAAVKRHIDFHIDAFQKTPLTVSLSGAKPRSKSYETIDAIVDYCIERRVGVGFRGLAPDDGKEHFWNWGEPRGYYHRIFERPYGKIPLHAESYRPHHRRDLTYTWEEVFVQLHYHIDYSNLRADYSKKELLPAFAFLRDHLGVTLEKAMDVWVALKPKRYRGNYEYWLYQNESVARTRSGRGGQPTRDYRETDQAKGRAWLAFGVDPGLVTDGADRFAIEVTYLDQGKDAWALEYQDRAGALRRAGTVRKTDTSSWKKHRFQLEDAAFGRGRNGMDFRLHGLDDGDDAFHLVQVFRLQERNVKRPRPRAVKVKKSTRHGAPVRKNVKKAGPDALAVWDARLLKRLQEALKAGKRPKFLLQSMRLRFEIAAVDEEKRLRLAGAGTEVPLAFSRLSVGERKSLAQALLRDESPDDHCLLAFYLLALGREDEAGAHLRKGGQKANAVRAVFQ